MKQTKARPHRPARKPRSNGRVWNGTAEVLTLAEAAAYLRVKEKDVLDLVARQEVPGQQIGAHWRFLKAALADWLRAPDRKQRLMRHAGALKDDPNLEKMIEQIYEERRRSVNEDE